MRSGENAEDVSTGEAHTQKKQIRKKRAEGYREHKQTTHRLWREAYREA